jgi:serine/threonine-protein kinase
MRQPREEEEKEASSPESKKATGRELQPGDRLDRYELVRASARGGTASLWQARQLGDHGFEKPVAVKTILPHFAGESRFREMLLGEAKIASRIDHPHVARILDLGERDDLLYLVMEWIEGRSLAELARHLAPVTDERGVRVLLRILADACAGLHAAHELRDPEGNLLSVVHRDVSPGNIVVDKHGMAKVIDFGLAKAMSLADEDTDPDILKGKFAYMSPEYVSDRVVDRRSDVWAIGVILYRFLSGKSPFEGESPIKTLQQIASGAAPAPLPDNVRPSLAAIVDRALAPDPEGRFATAAELRDALESAMQELGGSVTPAAVAEYLAEHAPASSDEVDAPRSKRDPAAASHAPKTTPPRKRHDRRAARRAGFIAVGMLFISSGLLLLDSVRTDAWPSTPASTAEQVVVEAEPMPCPLPTLDTLAEEPDDASRVRRSGEPSGKAKARTSLESQPPKTTERSAVLDFGI